MLLVLTALLCVVLAIHSSRERQYRLRVAAAQVLHDAGDIVSTEVGFVPLKGHLESGDVVNYVSAGPSISDEEVVAILTFSTLKDLDLSGWGVGHYRKPLHGKPHTPFDGQLSQLVRLPLIEQLTLARTEATDRGIAHLAGMRSLRVLKLHSTRITDDGLCHLASLRNLQELDLPGTEVTDDGIRHLCALTSLRRLNLADTRISEQALSILSNLPRLEELNLSGNDVRNDSLRFVALFPRLRFLELAETSIADGGLKALEPCDSLQGLDLEDCPGVTDAGLVSLTRMKSLEYVLLAHTAVSATGIAHFKDLKPHAEVSWDGSSAEDGN